MCAGLRDDVGGALPSGACEDITQSETADAADSIRKLLQSKAIAIENDLRGTLRNFGLKVGMVGKVKFEARIKELVENLPDLAELVEPLLIVRRVLREQIVILHRRLLAIVRDDEVCRRLMTTPGVGPVVALTYRATVDVPARFRKSKAVGAVFGLTCSKYQSGEVDRNGRISRCGDEMMRAMLLQGSSEHAAFEEMVLAQGLGDADRQAPRDQTAIVALARRLAVIMHRIWVDGTEFRWTRDGPQQQHENRAASNPIGGNSNSTERWNDVPRGTMDEVRSYVRLDLPSH